MHRGEIHQVRNRAERVRKELANPAFFLWAPLPTTYTKPSESVHGKEATEATSSRVPSTSAGACPSEGRVMGSSASARMAVQYARLAHKLAVGFVLPIDDILKSMAIGGYDAQPSQEMQITLEGVPVNGPFELGSQLVARLDQKYSAALAERRVVQGRIHLHQGISHLPCSVTTKLTRSFLSPSSTRFSDTEVCIILKAQLDLWPTATQLAKCSMSTLSGSVLCKFCRRQNETVSHLLSIAANQEAELLHPEPLASLATQRHDQIVRTLAHHLALSEQYTFVAVEKGVLVNTLGDVTPADHGSDPRPYRYHLLADQLLAPPNNVRFSKPDLMLVYRRKVGEVMSNVCLIVDVICAGDGHVLLENEIGYHNILDNLHLFNDEGLSVAADSEPSVGRGSRPPVVILARKRGQACDRRVQASTLRTYRTIF